MCDTGSKKKVNTDGKILKEATSLRPHNLQILFYSEGLTTNQYKFLYFYIE